MPKELQNADIPGGAPAPAGGGGEGKVTKKEIQLKSLGNADRPKKMAPIPAALLSIDTDLIYGAVSLGQPRRVFCHAFDRL